MIRLSICIATLNRADMLGETLDAILPQLSDEMEIVVIDGASTDQTAAVVAERRRRCSQVRYVRLAAKGGVDRDYCRAVEDARGEFCWLMTDDDVLVPGALARVESALGDDVDLVIVNAQVWSRDLRVCLQERKLPAPEDRWFAPGDMEALFRQAADLLSFIGSVVIRRRVWMERDKASYIGTEFVHVGVIFQRALAGQAVAIAEPLVRIRYGNAKWLPRAFTIWMFTWPSLLWSFETISAEAKSAVLAREPYRDLKQLLLAKARGYFTTQELRQLSGVRLSRWRRGVAWLMAAFPDRLFNAILYRIAPLVASSPALLRQELRASRFGGAKEHS